MLILGWGGAATASTPKSSDATPANGTYVTHVRHLDSGQELTSRSALSSPDGRYRLTVRPDGDLTVSVTASDRVRWRTGTTRVPASRLALQHDGNLVLYGAGGTAQWSTGTDGVGDARLTLGDDGGLVLTWAAGRREIVPPDDTLGPGEALRPGDTLTSPSGRFTLAMQQDGNLVESERDQGPVWATGTRGDNVTVVTAEGRLVVRRQGAGRTQWSPHERSDGSRLVVQDDGNVVLYDGDEPLWSRGDQQRRLAERKREAARSVEPGDDYPDRSATPCGAGVYCRQGDQYSARGFAYRNCTDFVAWKLGMTWSQIADGRNGHAVGWKRGWIERGRAVGTTPKVGSVAWWSRGSHGHVAYVVGVNPDGSAVVEQYNAGGTGDYSVQTVRAEAYLY